MSEETIPKIGTIIAKVAKGDKGVNLRDYRQIGGTCPFCGRDMEITNTYNVRHPPNPLIKMRCTKMEIDYIAKITPSKIVLYKIETGAGQ